MVLVLLSVLNGHKDFNIKDKLSGEEQKKSYVLTNLALCKDLMPQLFSRAVTPWGVLYIYAT